MQRVTNIKKAETTFDENEKIEDINNNLISEEIILDKETIKALMESEEDIENGRTRKATEVIREFKEKYGF